MKEWIPLLQSLAWPLFLTGLAIWLRASIKTVLIAIADRIRSGAPFEAGLGGIKIGSVVVPDRLESKAHLPITPTSEPNWLNRQRILDESSYGQKLKGELRAYVAERQKQIDAMEAQLKTMEQRLSTQSISARDDEGFKKEMEDYQLRVKKLNAQVQSRKALLLGEFNAEIDRAVAQVTRQGFQGQDPNLLVIQILNQQ